MDNLNWIRTSKLIVKENAGQSFKKIFGHDLDFEDIFAKNVTLGIAQMAKNSYNIIFKLGAIRAYLDCGKIGSTLTIIDVWRLY